MTQFDLNYLARSVGSLTSKSYIGRVVSVSENRIEVTGLLDVAALGNWVRIYRQDGSILRGEIIAIDLQTLTVMSDGPAVNIRIDDRVRLGSTPTISPDESWLGRVVDPFGRPLDGKPLVQGEVAYPLDNSAPDAHRRAPLGDRLKTGLCAFNTLLPIVSGQRIGLFSGSGVGKSTLLGTLATSIDVDVTIVALIGERGREVREFVDNTLGIEGMQNAIVVAATSDMSSLRRRNCAYAATAIAEAFRDQGKSVLLVMDSVTRFAEAHREVSTTGGELPALRGYPASTAQKIMNLCERTGPGVTDTGSITAIYSVLVSGSDMDEPIADILRGVLDGHVILDRSIAERGRFPAIDILRSVSRALPQAASDSENRMLIATRRLLGAYQTAEPMIRAGLYVSGSDPLIDDAIKVFDALDNFLATTEGAQIQDSFDKLSMILRSTHMFKMMQSAAN